MTKSLQNRWGLILPLLAFLVFCGYGGQAQTRSISGTVKDAESGQALPGVTILERGTANGTTTDTDGRFTLTVTDANARLVFSFIGFTSQEITVGTQTSLQVNLQTDITALEEVVVVGYGAQKKSEITGSISQVTADALIDVPNGRVETALQGRVAGVTIAQNSGQPGSASTIRIRGITTFGNAGNNPLWVVDGIVVDFAAIGFLNQQDIESIEVLKDATSAAIYGTRAATGVIIVTTKKGKAGKFTIDYNGFVGTSSPARRLNLLNAEQYGTIMNEKAVAAGQPAPFANPAALGEGTDWQNLIFNNSARRSNHQLSLSGGNDKSLFYFSLGYNNTEGIVATEISNFQQYNMRLNSSHKISKVFTIAQTLGYTNSYTRGIGNVNSEFGGPLSSAINLDPITPAVETDPARIAANPEYAQRFALRDQNNNLFGIPVGMQEMSNPLAFTQTRLGRQTWDHNFIGNISVDANISKNLVFKTIASGKLATFGEDGFTPSHYLGSGGGLNVPINNLTRNVHQRANWNVENFLTYTKSFQDHNVSVLLGQGMYVENLGGGNLFTLFDLPVNHYQDAHMGFFTPASVFTASAYSTRGDINNNIRKVNSLFTRVNYGYKDRYMLTGVLRRDGSNRFGRNNRYGVFPGASAGWNVSREAFWPSNKLVDFLKVRGGFGVTGNDAIRDFGFLALVPVGFNYTIGGNVINGYAPASLDNPDLRWEETTQTNVGFEATFLKDFDVTFDYFMKRTTGILRPVVIPGYVGVTTAPVANVADMNNSGFELELKYRKRIGPVNFSASANGATLRNEITHVAADVNFIVGDASFQNIGPLTRIQVGHSFNEFFGYKALGIFQNQADIDAHVSSTGALIQPNARPGDFKWADLNGDGMITDDNLDRTFLGTSIPKYTYGFTINADYKGFDMMIFANGAAGHKIFQGLRRLDIVNANYTTEALNRWTGEGTSNDFPRLVQGDPSRNFMRMSDFYLERGDFLRFRLIQFGYTLPQNAVLKRAGIGKLRFYVTAENLFTFTRYTGFDPEIGGGVFGIDRGQYPQARSFLLGAMIKI